MNLKQEKRFIGVSLNGVKIKAAEIALTNSVKLCAYAEEYLSPEIFGGGTEISNIPLFSETIVNMFQKNGFTDAPVVLGIKNQNMLIRLANFPKVPKDKIGNVIELQAQEFIPVPVEDLYIDYVVYDSIKQGEIELIPALLVCARKSYINNLMAVMAGTKNVIQNIDAGLLAIVRATANMISGVTLVMDVDDEAINIAVVKDEAILLARTVSLQNDFINLAKSYFDGNSGDELCRSLAEYLITDLNSSIMYFGNAYRGVNIDKILISGDMEYLEKCVPIIKDGVDIPLERAAFFEGLKNTSQDIRNKYAECVSLALSAVAD